MLLNMPCAGMIEEAAGNFRAPSLQEGFGAVLNF